MSDKAFNEGRFSLLQEKFKAKRKNEAKQSGVDVQDSELDVAMEEICKKWQEAESQDETCVSKKQIEADKVSREQVRRKVCEKLGETSKRKMEEAAEVKPRKSRRYMVAIPINFFVKKQCRTLQMIGTLKRELFCVRYKQLFGSLLT